jgi:hypothetical protein
MSINKPLASLSSSLLARKGQAAPAMRRQALQGVELDTHELEDLGWNDMGHEPREPVMPSVVHEQQQTIARELDAQPEFEQVEMVAPVTEIAEAPLKPRAAPGSKAKSAFTLRLDSERHLQLRLVCAMRHRSAQQIVTEALDAFLAHQPEVADLKRPQR